MLVAVLVSSVSASTRILFVKGASISTLEGVVDSVAVGTDVYVGSIGNSALLPVLLPLPLLVPLPDPVPVGVGIASIPTSTTLILRFFVFFSRFDSILSLLSLFWVLLLLTDTPTGTLRASVDTVLSAVAVLVIYLVSTVIPMSAVVAVESPTTTSTTAVLVVVAVVVLSIPPSTSISTSTCSVAPSLTSPPSTLSTPSTIDNVSTVDSAAGASTGIGTCIGIGSNNPSLGGHVTSPFDDFAT